MLPYIHICKIYTPHYIFSFSLYNVGVKSFCLSTLLLFSFHFASAAECLLQKSDELPADGYSKGLIIYEIKNLRECEQPKLPELLKFQQEIGSLVESTDPFELIDRQLKLWSRYPNVPKEYISTTQIVREGPLARKVYTLDKLDGLLYNEHLKKLDYRHEFLAHILKRPETEDFLILFTPGDIGVVNSHPDTEMLLSKYIREGFDFVAHFHSHPFLLDQEDIGAVPVFSTVDIRVLRDLSKRLPLREAWVTNGFHSLKIQVEDLDLFSADI